MTSPSPSIFFGVALFTLSLSAQQRVIKCETRLGTTSVVSPLRFENIVSNSTNRYVIDMAAELNIGYKPGSYYEYGLTIGSYSAEPGADDGHFASTTIGPYGKLFLPSITPLPYLTAGSGITGVSFKTPPVFGTGATRSVSWTAPWIYVGGGAEWKLSGFFLTMDVRYHMILIKDRVATVGQTTAPGGSRRNEFKLLNNVNFLSVAGGFIFDFPLTD